LPIQIRRRGVEKRLLIPGEGAPDPRLDRALLKAIARAHCWFDDLISGRVASMTEIAVREGVGKRYVSRLVRLGLLAPEIVDLIAQGRQAPELTAQSLLTGEREVALDWQAQKCTLGLTAQA
jgi:ParB-like chromosome segregation protein Spo0J